MKDIFSLSGRVALVTGGSRGIGAMIVRGFLEHGCSRVYITARKAAQCDEAAKSLSQYGECISIPCDISTFEGVQTLAKKIAELETTLDILVNNAGAAWGAKFDEFPESGWDKTVDINMKTPFFLTQALSPLLRAAAIKNSRVAKVINIASIDGISVTDMETYAYGASKAGLIHMTKRMALRLAPEKIGVSAIAPGAFASEMNKTARDHADLVATQIPSGRIGIPEDMAGAAIYLASKAGDYVVGSTIVVDGGVAYAR